MRRVVAAANAALTVAATAYAADETGKRVGAVDTPNCPIELRDRQIEVAACRRNLPRQHRRGRRDDRTGKIG